MLQSIETLLAEWATAERSGDTEKLDAALLGDDFYGVGPLGFVLPRPAWLARHREGDLTYETFDLADVHSHPVGGAAVVTARIDARGTYRGQRLPEAVRATLVIASREPTRRLAAVHMSFIAGTGGAPPLPGSAGAPPLPGYASGREVEGGPA
jgi:hypothetical protein